MPAEWIPYSSAIVEAANAAREYSKATPAVVVDAALAIAKTELGPDPYANGGFVAEAKMPKFVSALIRHLEEADKDVDLSFRSTTPVSVTGALSELEAMFLEATTAQRARATVTTAASPPPAAVAKAAPVTVFEILPDGRRLRR